MRAIRLGIVNAELYFNCIALCRWYMTHWHNLFFFFWHCASSKFTTFRKPALLPSSDKESTQSSGPLTESISQLLSSRLYDLIDFLFTFFLAYLQNVFQTQVWLNASLSTCSEWFQWRFRDGNDFGSTFIVNTDVRVFHRPGNTQRLSPAA